MKSRGMIRIAPVHGFCSGVKRAVDMVEQAVKNGNLPVRVLHEIVHNKHIVEDFQKKGVLFFDELDPAWQNGTLIFSAHGVSTKIELQAKKLPLNLLDATCPLVKQIHHHAMELEKAGFRILFIGKHNHRETQGVAGRLKKEPVILESPEDCMAFTPEKTVRYACLTQTTLSQDDCNTMLNLLKEKIPDLEIRSGICMATSKRQNAVKQLAETCSRIIVVGDSASSNSKRLCETAIAAGAQAILVSSAEMVPDSFLDFYGDIGVTSGASAPEYLLDSLLDHLRNKGFVSEENERGASCRI